MNRLLLFLVTMFGSTIQPPAEAGATRRQFENAPIHFIENRGQLDGPAAYYVQGRDTNIYFSSRGVTFLLSPAAGRARSAINLDFPGSNPHATIKGLSRMPAVVHYFSGPRDNWKTGIATFGTLAYEDLWPGIDLVYGGGASRLKYTFIVKPGADPNAIRLSYSGATSVSLTAEGGLELRTPAGGFSDEKPYSYQEIDGARIEVPSEYEVVADAADPKTIGFRVGDWDRSRPLVLDPVMSIYSGYLGGSGSDRALGITVDQNGNAYVTGSTASLDFPVAGGPALTAHNAGDAFVAKLNPEGGLVYAGYIGGSGEDVGFDIAVDQQGNAYVAGAAASTEATFPTEVGPDLIYGGGTFDGFIAKLTADGADLVYCGYIGGANTDGATGIAVSAAGNAFVTGATNSTESSFPVVAGPGSVFRGGHLFGDAFVAKISATGANLDYSGYVGGMGEDAGTSIAIDAAGNAYITGGTTSADFPASTGPDLSYNGGFRDAFVTKINPSGTALIYSGFIGGASADTGFGIAVDSAGNAYIAGETGSSEATFPVRTGPDLTFNGIADGFATKLDSQGATIVYSGYIGGSGRDGATGIAVDAAGNAYVTGATASTNSFTQAGGPDLTFNGGGFLGDAFAMKIDASTAAVVYNTYIGGEDDDIGYSIAVDGIGHAFVAGETSSGSFPSAGSADNSYNGGVRDGFVVRLGEPVILSDSMSGSIVSRSGPANARVWTVRLINNGPGVAIGAAISGLTLTQTFGPACSPVISAVFPLGAGSIDAGGSANLPVAINFTGCQPLARFTVTIPFSANEGRLTGSIVRHNLFQ